MQIKSLGYYAFSEIIAKVRDNIIPVFPCQRRRTAVAGASTALVNTIYNLGSNTKYSYIIYGPQTAVGALLLPDSFNDPGDGFFAAD